MFQNTPTLRQPLQHHAAYPSKHDALHQWCYLPANTGHSPNAVSLLAQRLRRWTNIETALGLDVFTSFYYRFNMFNMFNLCIYFVKAKAVFVYMKHKQLLAFGFALQYIYVEPGWGGGGNTKTTQSRRYSLHTLLIYQTLTRITHHLWLALDSMLFGQTWYPGIESPAWTRRSPNVAVMAGQHSL